MQIILRDFLLATTWMFTFIEERSLEVATYDVFRRSRFSKILTSNIQDDVLRK